jgi:hypothetical protein
MDGVLGPWGGGAAEARLVWPDGRPVDGLLLRHWRLGEDPSGRRLYAGLFDHGAGWRRRRAAGTTEQATAWALLAEGPPGAPDALEVLQPDLLCANPRGPDDGAPGGGSVVRTRLAGTTGEDGLAYALFYTARALAVPRVVLGEAEEAASTVRLAVLRREPLAGGVEATVWRVRRTELALGPDPAVHVTAADVGVGPPTFQDPCLFVDGRGDPHLVVASRSRAGPPGADAGLTFYRVAGPLDAAVAYRRAGAFAPGVYARMSNPHVAWVGDAAWLSFEASAAPEGPMALWAARLPLGPDGGLEAGGGEVRCADAVELLAADRGLSGGFVEDGALRVSAAADGGPMVVGPAPWPAQERLHLEEHTALAGPLGRAAELTDATHQWELRKAALFARELSPVQRRALRGGAALAAVLNPGQRRVLEAFYAGRL